MTNCYKAIEILQRTHDGDDLAPQHLKLIELAVNDVLTESGQVAFEQLHTQVTGGTYVALVSRHRVSPERPPRLRVLEGDSGGSLQF
jgi:hypothetical protein